MECVASPDEPDCNIVRFDIAVGNTLFLEMANHIQKIFTEPLQELHVEPAFLSQAVAERFDDFLFLICKNGLHQKRRPVAYFDEPAVVHNVCVPELFQHLRFILDPSIVLGIIRRLEYELLIIA